MKRAMLEIAVVGGLLFATAALYGEIDSLRHKTHDREAEISSLEALVRAGVAKPRSGRPVTQEDLQEVELKLAKVQGELAKVQARLEEASRRAISRASEAMGTSKELTRTIESAQRLASRAQDRMKALASRLEDRIQAQEEVIRQLRRRLTGDSRAMTNAMLAPTVQISGEETVGSGTIIGSQKRRDGGYRTYVLTAWHVVRNIFTDEPERKRKGLLVTIYARGRKIERVGDLIAKDPSRDLALILLRGREKAPAVARIIDEDRARSIDLWEPLYAIGCPLGNDPIPTGGFLASKDSRIDGLGYWMINAPTYFGNSGGGIFDARTYELVAVFSKIFTHGKVHPTVISHMGLAVPPREVYAFLRETGHSDLLPQPRMPAAAPGR